MARQSTRLEPGDLFGGLSRAAAKTEWTPVFTDDFSQPDLGPEWLLRNARCTVADGWLHLTGTEGAADIYAVLCRPFPDNVRVEYRARFPAGPQRNSDLSCFICGTENECDARGYCLAFASDQNTCTRVQREGVDLRINPDAVAEPGRTYQVAAEIIDGNLSVYVDGKRVIEYLDLLPLSGRGHDRLGLATHGSGAEFGEFRVLVPTGRSEAGVFTVPDAYCRDGQFQLAIDKYHQIASAHAGRLTGLLARCKVALALMSAGQWAEAEEHLRSLESHVTDRDLFLMIGLWRARSLGMMGKMFDALRLLAKVQTSSDDPGLIDEVAVSCGLMTEAMKKEGRWLEAGLCAKFMFENLRTPLLGTLHMFGRYVERLSDAALYEELFQAIGKLGNAVAERHKDPVLAARLNLQRAAAAIVCGRTDTAEEIYEKLAQEAAAVGARRLVLTIEGLRASLDLSLGRYEAANARLARYAGTSEDDVPIPQCVWGNSVADIRVASSILLGNIDDDLKALASGSFCARWSDVRMILGAELRRRGDRAAAEACMMLDSATPGYHRILRKLVTMSAASMLGKCPAQELRDFVDSQLPPSHHARGLVYAGLVSMATGNDGAAILAWSEAANSAPETTPPWHWAGYGQRRVSGQAGAP